MTGANSGIGRATVDLLLGLEANVVMTARRSDAGAATAQALKQKHPSAALEFVSLNLSESTSVKETSKRILAGGIDVLVNNAGGMADGTLEEMFLGNVLGHYQLTQALLPSLLAAKGKVVILSSAGHAMAQLPRPDESIAELIKTGRGSSIGKYGFTKLCGVWHAIGLHRRYGTSGLRTYALHPGGIATEGFDKTKGLPFHERLGSLFYKNVFAEKDVSLGAQTTLHCIGNTEANGESGKYYDNCQPVTPHHCDDKMRIDEMFDYCEQRLA